LDFGNNGDSFAFSGGDGLLRMFKLNMIVWYNHIFCKKLKLPV